ncbi:uncharacterized protein B4U80_01828, partial [Leptotrombidium deliense]
MSQLINLKSDTPIRRPPYRHPRWKRDIINEQVQELLANGSIRESDSPYGSPVTTVMKADGTHRLVIDVRELNKVTVDDIEPMPNIDDIIEDTVHSRFFSKLDIKWFYHHFQIATEDIRKTGFVTQDGHFEFLVVPFGAKNAPFFCQRQLRRLLRKHRKHVVTYLDDILIHTAELKTHLSILREILEIIRQNNFRLRQKKCSFAANSVAFLGHVIEDGTVRPSDRHVEALKVYRQP